MIREQIYDMNSIPVLETIVRDVRYACRILRKSPAFTVTAVLTLGLAIGVNTAVFSVVDAVLLKPLPYPQSDQLALVSRVERLQGNEGRSASVDGTTWQLIRDHVPSAESAVFSTWTSGVNLVAPGPARRAAGALRASAAGRREFLYGAASAAACRTGLRR